MKPLISIIIPCRNEEKNIGKCLDSILKQDYPKERIEVLVIDGMSEDHTKDIIKDYIKKYPFIKLLDNPKKFTSFSLNTSLKVAKGEIIIRMDAHASYKSNYVSKCIDHIITSKADNVGGVIKTLPAKNTLIARAIAISLSSLFGSVSDFRVGSDGVKPVDTVFGGCYRKEVFKKNGLFNENLIRSQDLEFNLRLKKTGGTILLFPDIVAYYYPSSDLRDFFRHNFEDGMWAIYPFKFVKIPFGLRHYIPLIFMLSLIGTGILGIFLSSFLWLFLFIIVSYFLVAIYFSLKTSVTEKDIRFLFILPIVFSTRHIGYGLGSILGLIKLLF